MSIFNFGKNKEPAKKESCCCGAKNVTADDMTKASFTTKNDTAGVKVLGSGCKSCHELFENAQKAVSDMGLSVEVEYVTDMEKVVSYGVMSTPALVVNDKVVSMGKVLKPVDVEKLLHKLGF